MTGALGRRFIERSFEGGDHGCSHVIFVDMDDFKTVNDDHGHAVGDELLQRVAQRMMSIAGSGNPVVRLGGDEFCVMVRHLETLEIEAFADTLRTAIADVSVLKDTMNVGRSASIGVTAVDRYQPLIEVLLNADRALMCAKRAGRNRTVAARAVERIQANARPSIEEIHLGLERGEFGYHVQPIFSAADLQPIGAEGLIRWTRPSGEVLGPALFLETMQAGYHRTLRPPVEHARATATAITGAGDYFISFNISSLFLERAQHTDLNWVDAIIGDAPRDRVVLELVETAVIGRPGDLRRMIDMLRETGIRVALDDFGVAQSSLERLQNAPVDIVKVDRRFVATAPERERDRNILSSLIDLCRRLEVQTVVEGIERAEELELVRALGANAVQGYFLGRPAPFASWETTFSSGGTGAPLPMVEGPVG
ncbi:MAG: EAL domain-containing protein [Shimia sp.]